MIMSRSRKKFPSCSYYDFHANQNKRTSNKRLRYKTKIILQQNNYDFLLFPLIHIELSSRAYFFKRKYPYFSNRYHRYILRFNKSNIPYLKKDKTILSAYIDFIKKTKK